MAENRSRRGQWFEARGTEWLGEDAPPVRRPMERPEVLSLVDLEKRRAKRRAKRARRRARDLEAASLSLPGPPAAPALVAAGMVQVSVNGRGVAADTVGQVLEFVNRPRAVKGLWAVTFMTKAGERITLFRDTRKPEWKQWVVDSEVKA